MPATPRPAARGDRATIVSSDKDLMQLVRPGVLQFDPARDRWFDSARVVAKTGLEPVRIRDWLALAGDSSASIPGVPGIGAKRATDLLARYGDIDALLEAGEAIQPAVCRSAILANREALTLSRQLATLDAAAPRLLDPGAMRAPDRERMREAIGAWLAANAI